MAIISKNLGLIQAVHTGATAPSNTFMIWVDNGVTPQIHKVYDDVALTWIPLATTTLTRPAVHAVFDNSGAGLPNNTATTIDGYTITNDDRVIVLDSLVGSEVNKVYAASVAGSSIVWAVAQDGTGQDLPESGAISWVINGIAYGSSQAIFDGITWQFSDAHTQNTDTGTNQTSFDIDSVGTGVKLKIVGGELQLRDLIDTVFADLRVGNLTVEGTETIVNSEIVEIADNIITLNSNVDSGAPSEDGGIHIKRGDELNASMIWNETLDVWTAGIAGSELPILFADKANTLSSNTSFVMGDYGLELNTAEFKMEYGITNDIKSVGVTATEAYLQASDGVDASKFSADIINGLVLTDDIYDIGAVYANEYTAPIDRKWLTHRGYVDDSIAGVTTTSPFEYHGTQSARSKGVQGAGTVSVTNGLAAVSGSGTNFLDATAFTGVAYWGQIWLYDGVEWHRLLINPTTGTTANITTAYKTSQIEDGYASSDSTYKGITGTYDYYSVQQVAQDGWSYSFGNNAWADNFATSIGTGVAIGAISFSQGDATFASGVQSVALIKNTRAEGNYSLAGGLGLGTSTGKQIISSGQTSFNFSENSAAQTAGFGALAANSAILAGINAHIPADSPRSVIIGGSGIVADAALPDIVYVPNLRIPLAGEIQFGDGDTKIYETSDDVLAISVENDVKYTWTTIGDYLAATAGGAALRDRVSTAIVPTLIPNNSSLISGIGGAAGEVDIITNSLSRLNVTDTLITANKPLRISTIGDGLEFGDGDTKIYEASDDILTFAIGDTARWSMSNAILSGVAIGSALIRSTGVAYGFVGDANAGLQYNAADDWSVLVGGADVLNFTTALQTFSTVVSGVDPVIDAHFATKGYVDRIASSDTKDSVRVATTANITLSGEQTIDGVLTSADRILVKDQTSPAENGIYVTSSGAWARSSDANTDEQVTSGMTTWIEEGTTNGSTSWTLTTPNPITLDVTGLSFTTTSAGASVDAQNGLSKNGIYIELGGTLLGATDIDTDTYALSFSGTGGLDVNSNPITSTTGSVIINDDIALNANGIIRGSGSEIIFRNTADSDYAIVHTGNIRLQTSTFYTSLEDTSTANRTISLPDIDGTIMLNLVEDTTPQLGGNLDIQTFKIFGVSGTGGLTMDGVGNTTLSHASETGLYFDVSETNPVIRRNDAAGGIRLMSGGLRIDGTNIYLRPDNADTVNTTLTLGGISQGGAQNIVLNNYGTTPFNAATGNQNFLEFTGATLNQSGDASFDLIRANVIETSTGSGERNLISLSVGGANRFKQNTQGHIFISTPQTEATPSTSTILTRNTAGEIVKIVAPSTSTGRFLKDDFTWGLPSGHDGNDFVITAGSGWNSTTGLLTLAVPNQTDATVAITDLETYFDGIYAPISVVDTNFYLSAINTADLGNVDFTITNGTDVVDIDFRPAWSDVQSTPTTLAGYGISDTKANFNTALSDDTFAYLNEIQTFTALSTFAAVDTGAFGAYDIEIGTGSYGMIHVGTSTFGRTSRVNANLDLDGTVVLINAATPPTSNILFAMMDGSNSMRFALPKSGVGNATYNPRSMILAGAAPNDDEAVTVGYWQGLGIFHNLVMDTDTDGADLGVQNDLEVEGDIFTDSIKESTTAAGVTIDGMLIKDGGITASIVGITGTRAQFDAAVVGDDFMYIGDAPTAHTLLGHDIAGETQGHVLAADTPTTYRIRELLGSEINNDLSWNDYNFSLGGDLGVNQAVDDGDIVDITGGIGVRTQVSKATTIVTLDVFLAVDELSEKTGVVAGTDRLVGTTGTTNWAETISGIPLSVFNDDLGHTTDNYVDGMSFSGGTLTLTRNILGDLTQSLDGRYALIGDAFPGFSTLLADYSYTIPTGNQIIDWAATQTPNIHADNYTNTTYVSSDFTHDSLTGVDADEHIDWSVTNAKNIHIDNYTAGDPSWLLENTSTLTGATIIDSATYDLTIGKASNNYALKQVGATGITTLNTNAGQALYLSIGDTWKWSVNSGGSLVGAASSGLILGSLPGDMTSSNGKMWYNSSTDKIRAFENGIAYDVIGLGGTVTSTGTYSSGEIATFTTQDNINGDNLLKWSSTIGLFVSVNSAGNTVKKSLNLYAYNSSAVGGVGLANSIVALVENSLGTTTDSFSFIGTSIGGTTPGTDFQLQTADNTGTLQDRITISNTGAFTFDSNIGGGEPATKYLNAEGGWTTPSDAAGLTSSAGTVSGITLTDNGTVVTLGGALTGFSPTSHDHDSDYANITVVSGLTSSAGTISGITLTDNGTTVTLGGAIGTLNQDTTGEAARAKGLNRSDSASDVYNVQSRWQYDKSGYWTLAGFNTNTFHADCWVGWAGTADNATNASTVTASAQTTSADDHFILFSLTDTTLSPKYANATRVLRYRPSTGLLSATDIGSGSDERLKYGWKPFGSVLNGITKLKGQFKHFSWLDNDVEDIGYSAQFMQTVFPSLVLEDENSTEIEKSLSLRYYKMGAIAMEGVAELRDEKDIEIERLNKRLTILEDWKTNVIKNGFNN
jgi:hypothetical protein